MSAAQAPRRRVPRGLWYFVIPVITFGWLSAIPFIHAWLRLRDRRVLLLAGVYAIVGAMSFILIPADAQSDTGWRGDVGVWLGFLLAGSACVLLVPLRRRVFSAPTEVDGPPQDPHRDERAQATPSETGSPVTWTDPFQVPPEIRTRKAQPTGTPPAQPSGTAVTPERTPCEPPSATSPVYGPPASNAAPNLGSVFGLELGCAGVAFLTALIAGIGVATCTAETSCSDLLSIAWTILVAAHPVLIAVCATLFIVGAWKKRDALKRGAVVVLPVGLTVAWVLFLTLM